MQILETMEHDGAGCKNFLIFAINLTFSKILEVRSFTFLQSRKGSITFVNNNNNYMLKT